MHLAREGRLGDLIEGHAAHRHPELLAVPLVALVSGHLAQVAGQEHPQRLARSAGAGVVVDEQVPLAGREVGLLVQLARRREVGRLAVDVEQAGGQLPLERPDGVAVLLHQHDPLLLVEREHGHGAGVVDEVPGDDTALAQVHLLADDVPDAPVERPRAREHRPGVAVGHAAAQACASAGSWCRGRSTSTSRDARWASMAAPISPAKSGCARVGRDLNSGCAWVDT